MRAKGRLISVASLLLALNACEGLDIQSGGQAVTTATAGGPTTANAVATPSLSNRSGSQQQRDCLHCAP